MVTTHHLPDLTRFWSTRSTAKLAPHKLTNYRCIHPPRTRWTTTFQNHQSWFRLRTSVAKFSVQRIDCHMLFESLSCPEHHTLCNLAAVISNFT
ncbi:hypothetical protein Bca4012_075384 [Brassica carinata]